MKYDADIAQKEFEIRQINNDLEKYKRSQIQFDLKVKDNETLMETISKSMATFDR
jgi:hypothetical protein